MRKLWTIALTLVCGIGLGATCVWWISDADAADKGKGKDKGLAGKMEHGIKELHKVKAHLEKAPPKYGGHRAHAIKDIDHAIRQLHEAIAYVKKKK